MRVLSGEICWSGYIFNFGYLLARDCFVRIVEIAISQIEKCRYENRNLHCEMENLVQYGEQL